MLQAVVESKRGVLVEDTRLEPRWSGEVVDPVRSLLGVPLLGRRGVLGVLSLGHTAPGHFCADNLALLQAIASQAAIALENAQLSKDAEQMKNEFIAQVAHDLKNPITALVSYGSVLEKAGPLAANQSKYLSRMRQAALQMDEMVQKLLELVRLEAGEAFPLEPLDLNALLAALTREFELQAEVRGLLLAYAPLTGYPFVFGNVTRLRQALRNLLSNALKYTSRGGRVTVSAETAGARVRLKVQDTGIGIPATALSHIFDKFYRVHSEDTRDIEGHGLGLAIVKSIVEQHSGEIAVESVVGQGSCFSFCLTPVIPGKPFLTPPGGPAGQPQRQTTGGFQAEYRTSTNGMAGFSNLESTSFDQRPIVAAHLA